MFVPAVIATVSLLATLPACPLPQGDGNGSGAGAAPAAAKTQEPILDKSAQDGLAKKLQAYLEAEAAYMSSDSSKEREKLAKKRESAKDAFIKDWESKTKKGDLLASMPDLRAIYQNCFTLERPRNAPGTPRKYEVELRDGKAEYVLLLPKKYKPDAPMRTVIVLPGTKAADQMSSWEDADRYLDQIWPRKCEARETTIFHVPQLPEGLEMDPMPDYSREGQEAQEQRRIAVVFGTYGETMRDVNVDRPRVFLDCGRGDCAFGLRFVSMFPDRFAGIVLRDPTKVEDLRLGSLTGMPVLMLKTADNAGVVDTLKQRLDAVSPEAVSVLDATDAYPFEAANEAISKWMDEHERDMTPKHVVIEPNHDRFNRAYWARIGRMNPVHGTAADQRPRLEVTADRASNRIVVKAQGVESFSLMLNDDLVDLDKEFTVVINDKAVTEQKRRDQRGMQERMLERRDWDFLFPVEFQSTVPKAEPKEGEPNK
ncbi:MAG: hypothetical protein KDE27_03510 [Planctomycetes bacterium]|nr:hypothetical protein [Planctomycetota bacterium]